MQGKISTSLVVKLEGPVAMAMQSSISGIMQTHPAMENFSCSPLTQCVSFTAPDKNTAKEYCIKLTEDIFFSDTYKVEQQISYNSTESQEISPQLHPKVPKQSHQNRQPSKQESSALPQNQPPKGHHDESYPLENGITLVIGSVSALKQADAWFTVEKGHSVLMSNELLYTIRMQRKNKEEGPEDIKNIAIKGKTLSTERAARLFHRVVSIAFETAKKHKFNSIALVNIYSLSLDNPEVVVQGLSAQESVPDLKYVMLVLQDKELCKKFHEGYKSNMTPQIDPLPASPTKSLSADVFEIDLPVGNPGLETKLVNTSFLNEHYSIKSVAYHHPITTTSATDLVFDPKLSDLDRALKGQIRSNLEHRRTCAAVGSVDVYTEYPLDDSIFSKFLIICNRWGGTASDEMLKEATQKVIKETENLETDTLAIELVSYSQVFDATVPQVLGVFQTSLDGISLEHLKRIAFVITDRCTFQQVTPAIISKSSSHTESSV